MGVLFYLVVLGFVVVFIVYLLIILGLNYFVENNVIFVLYFLIFILFIGMFIYFCKGLLILDKKVYFKDLFKGIFKVMRVLVIGVFIYVGINFMYLIMLLLEGLLVI